MTSIWMRLFSEGKVLWKASQHAAGQQVCGHELFFIWSFPFYSMVWLDHECVASSNMHKYTWRTNSFCFFSLFVMTLVLCLRACLCSDFFLSRSHHWGHLQSGGVKGWEEMWPFASWPVLQLRAIRCKGASLFKGRVSHIHVGFTRKLMVWCFAS